MFFSLPVLLSTRFFPLFFFWSCRIFFKELNLSIKNNNNNSKKAPSRLASPDLLGERHVVEPQQLLFEIILGPPRGIRGNLLVDLLHHPSSHRVALLSHLRYPLLHHQIGVQLSRIHRQLLQDLFHRGSNRSCCLWGCKVRNVHNARTMNTLLLHSAPFLTPGLSPSPCVPPSLSLFSSPIMIENMGLRHFLKFRPYLCGLILFSFSLFIWFEKPKNRSTDNLCYVHI